MKLVSGLSAELRGWRDAYIAVHAVGALSGLRASILVLLVILSIASEVFGLAMIYPLLSYLEHRGNLEQLTAGSKLWQGLVNIYSSAGLPINYATLAGAVFCMIVIRQICSVANMRFGAAIKEDFSAAMRNRLFRTLMQSRAVHLNRLNSGAITAWFGQMTQQASMVTNNLVTGLTLAISILVYSAGLLYLAPAITMIVFVLAATGAAAFGRTVNTAKEISKSVAKANEVFSHKATERLRAWRLVKLSGNDIHEAVYLGKISRGIADLYMRHVSEVAKVQLVVTPATILLLLSIVYVADRHFETPLVLLFVFATAVIRLAPLLEAAVRLRQNFSIANAAMDRLSAVLADAAAAREEDAGMLDCPLPQSGITFEQVSYSYGPDGPAALQDVSCTIPAGKLTAVVGPSGAGKSTLVDMLPRLLEPQAGRILIDDVPLASVRLGALRNCIAFVSQHPLLFDDSVRSNLMYARPDASVADLQEACRLAHVDEFVSALPDGLDTRVGEGGVLLSGGQRQRLMLARAFLSKAPILIMDEPTSALDWESEQLIRAALQAVKVKNKITIIVIAHRPSTIADADFVVALRDGRVFECGTPSSLESPNSYYRHMLAAGTGEAAAGA